MNSSQSIKSNAPQTFKNTRIQPLSTGDKASIYDWLRQAAPSQLSAEHIATAIQEAAAKSSDAESFDELMLQAMVANLDPHQEQGAGGCAVRQGPGECQ